MLRRVVCAQRFAFPFKSPLICGLSSADRPNSSRTFIFDDHSASPAIDQRGAPPRDRRLLRGQSLYLFNRRPHQRRCDVNALHGIVANCFRGDQRFFDRWRLFANSPRAPFRLPHCAHRRTVNALHFLELGASPSSPFNRHVSTAAAVQQRTLLPRSNTKCLPLGDAHGVLTSRNGSPSNQR